ncbi:ABC-three component system protein [Cryobacterium cryoconiti]|uniref:ABC-three component systems C-terminal domain-containing protein n=1 Tax=Cryobacterium cryoconiti TaxID=1259239 RepID=A0A4Y8JS62_9MICO|nr:ABC-three component system protein [Cryobacterium cryoconiti]TFD28273.1 hypothetical protein E3T49_12235 [Cryobacterium cryoconiti]
MTVRDPAWRDWYRSQHESRCRSTGSSFEDYVSDALSRFHGDYFNPSPAGSLGDGGCDGLAEAGSIVYACYGSRADGERALGAKMASDFDRAVSEWSDFTVWRFVTNAHPGPVAAAFIIKFQKAHAPASSRPISPVIWVPTDLWSKVIRDLPARDLADVFPGVPRAENVELADLLPLLDSLGNTPATTDEVGASIRPVPASKMRFNKLPSSARFEFNEGRLTAPRIDQWFDDQADPGLRDQQGEKFRCIYTQQRESTDIPSEILERIYTALGGSDFRMDSKRANAVYAVTAYFFDSCHIFEEPPADYDSEQALAATD